MKAVRRRLGILAICIVLVFVSVSLGMWVTRRQGEMGAVSWSPLFESSVRRALTPLKTVEAMAQGKPTEQCQLTADCEATNDCPVETSDCEPEETRDCEPKETTGGAACETVDTTCDCETWDDTCDCTGTCDERNCETFCGAACFYRDFRLPTVSITCDCDYETMSDETCDATCEVTCSDETCDATCEHTCERETCDSDCVETLEGETCEGTCVGETCYGMYRCFRLATVDATCDCVTFGATCYSDDPECVDTVGETCDCPLVIEGHGWLLTWFDTCGCETVDATCDGTCIDTCSCGFDTWDITCECKTWADDTCDCETVPCVTLGCSDTSDCRTWDDETCDATCDGSDPSCADTVDFTCDVDHCEETFDRTCAADDPDCGEGE
jgi:hypothetical protein